MLNRKNNTLKLVRSLLVTEKLKVKLAERSDMLAEQKCQAVARDQNILGGAAVKLSAFF